MEIEDPSIANNEIDSNNHLKTLFGFKCFEKVNIIEEFSSDEQEDSDNYESSDSEIFNFRPDNQQTSPKQEKENLDEAESSGTKNDSRKRKGNFFEPIPVIKNNNIFGSNILNIDCTANRKELIDIWAQEISLIIQTSDSYQDCNAVLLLIEHKTTGIVNSFIKNTTWNQRKDPIGAFDDILDAIYTMFLGIDLTENKLQESKLTYQIPMSHLLQIQTEEPIELVMPNITNPNSIYIAGKLKFAGYKQIELHCYVDTGASMCVASQYVIPKEHWVNAERPIRAKIADGSIVTINKVCKNLDILIAGEIFHIPTIYQQESDLDFILEVFISKVTTAYRVGVKGFLESMKKKSKVQQPKPLNISPNKIHLLKRGNDRIKIFKICSDNPLDPTKTKYWMKANIKLKDPKTIVKVKPMKYSPQDREEFAKQIQELLDMKIIIPSKSPHQSPAFLVEKEAEKRRGKKRMVVNYKSINDATIGDSHNLPNKDELFTLIRGKKMFSSLDCKSGFWQVLLDQESQLLTAFTCPQGTYQWTVVPFGLKQAPSIFQRHMQDAFRLAAVLKKCQSLGIILSKKKAQLFKTKINFLGLEIDQGTHCPQRHILEHIHKFPDRLEDKKQLQRFLGILTYASDYIPKLATIRAPLQVKLKKDVPWNGMIQIPITFVKKNLTTFPKLYHPLPEDKLIIETDASGEYWGGVLKAINSDQELICRYASGSFKDAEKNYHSNEKEYLAVIRVINKFSIYLTPVKFLVRTDNKNFTYFLRIKLQGDNKQGRLVRWQQWLSRYDFDVQHIEGTKNCLADFLTREFQKCIPFLQQKPHANKGLTPKNKDLSSKMEKLIAQKSIILKRIQLLQNELTLIDSEIDFERKFSSKQAIVTPAVKIPEVTTIPKQTASGKESPNPLTPVTLVKSQFEDSSSSTSGSSDLNLRPNEGILHPNKSKEKFLVHSHGCLGAKAYYVVFNGPKAGIYTTWSMAEQATKGYSSVKHRKYKSYDEARIAANIFTSEEFKAPLELINGSEGLKPTFAKSLTKEKSSKVILGSTPKIQHPVVKLEDMEDYDLESSYSGFDYMYKKGRESTALDFVDERFYTSDKRNISYFNFFPNADPLFILEAYHYGLLSMVYPSNSLLEISKFPKEFRDAIKAYKKKCLKGLEKEIYLNFQSTVMFWDEDEQPIQTYNYVQIGVIKEKIYSPGQAMKATLEEKDLQENC
ncbi:LOW QUALITY PROTEIN: hypothetical protein OSB04_un001816 [Centaurea solstitialis]|uniref:RNA-directed DNA polymerase n=1 Tax=Centaurea solstitialis TaxID=347529 RepID=A0AA38SF06_9ASTR|nr:LOW QUALITY PROTEIN: hypothetical protein OSB04_un001816 [Centaurea solstitialis]